MITFIILISCLIGAIQLHMKNKPNRKYTIPNVTYEKRSITKEEEQDIKNEIEIKKRSKYERGIMMVSLKEIKQYLEKRIGKTTTIEDVDFKLADVLEVENQENIIIIVFVVNDNSLVFQVGGNGLPIIIADKKVDCISRYVRFESEESFTGILYRFLEQYAKNVEIIENDGVERDIFVWH